MVCFGNFLGYGFPAYSLAQFKNSSRWEILYAKVASLRS